MFGWFKKAVDPRPETCYLCQRNIDEDYSSLAFESMDDDLNLEVHNFAKICSDCANILDNHDKNYVESGKDE